MSSYRYERLKLERTNNGTVIELVLNRPSKLNTMDAKFFEEVGRAFDEITADEEARAVVIWAEGKLFTAGLDLKSSGILSAEEGSKADQNRKLYKYIRTIQDSFSKIERCPKPVIVAVDGKCIGGGVDMITACDIRLCSESAEFSIKETQIAIVADLGTLQRIGKVTSKGFAREMAFTGDGVSAQRALQFGFVNKVYKDKTELLQGAREMAAKIARNSPLVVQGTKLVLNYADEHSTDDSNISNIACVDCYAGLNQVALWNTAFLQSDDLMEALSAFMEKRTPVFKSKL